MNNKIRILLNFLIRKNLVLIVDEIDPEAASFKALELGLIPRVFIRFEGKSYLIIGEQ